MTSPSLVHLKSVRFFLQGLAIVMSWQVNVHSQVLQGKSVKCQVTSQLIWQKSKSVTKSLGVGASLVSNLSKSKPQVIWNKSVPDGSQSQFWGKVQVRSQVLQTKFKSQIKAVTASLSQMWSLSDQLSCHRLSPSSPCTFNLKFVRASVKSYVIWDKSKSGISQVIVLSEQVSYQVFFGWD